MSNIRLSYKNAITIPGNLAGPFTASTDLLTNPVVSITARSADTLRKTTWMRLKPSPLLSTGLAALTYHNLSQHASACLRVGLSSLDIDFLMGMESDSRLTSTVSTAGTVTDQAGNLVPVTVSTQPRIDHYGNLFNNGLKYSDDLTQSVWTFSGATPDADKQTVMFSTTGTFRQAIFVQQGVGLVLSGKARLLSGDGSFRFAVNDGTTDWVGGTTHVAGSEWKPFTVTISGTTFSPGVSMLGAFIVQKLNAAGVLQFKNLQVSSQVASAFQRTTTSRIARRKGMLKEPAAVNSLIAASDLSNVAWVKTASISTNTRTAPDTNLAMDRVTSVSANEYVYQDVVLGGTSTRVMSCFFYPGTATSVQLALTWMTGGATQSVSFSFNPNNPNTGATTAASGAALKQFGVEYCGGGIWRAWVSGTGTDAANTVVRHQLTMLQAATNVELWGFQGEANWLTSFIPTTTTAVTRAGDTVSIGSTNFSDFYSSVEGTLFTQSMASPTTLSLAGALEPIVTLRDATTNVLWTHRYGGGAAPFAEVLTSTGWNSADKLVNGNEVTYMASRLRPANLQLAVNSTLLGSSGNAMPTGAANLDIASATNQSMYPMWIQRVTYWPAGLTDTELTALSTSGPSAVDYDSGWQPVLQMDMASQINEKRWGLKYDVQFSFPTTAVRQGVVFMLDEGNDDGYLTLGRIFLASYSFSPVINAQWGASEGLQDYSTSFVSATGAQWVTPKPRLRTTAFQFAELLPAEADKLHELQSYVGTTDEVYYEPDPADPARSQRYGFLGMLQNVNPLTYPQFNRREHAFQMIQKG